MEVPVTKGRHRVHAYYPSAAVWNSLSIQDTLLIGAGETVVRRYVLGSLVHVQTVPSGAVVASADSALGLTPFVYRSRETQTAKITLRKEGFRDTVVILYPKPSVVRILLDPAAETNRATPARSLQDPISPPDEGRPAWSAYVAAASTVGFGIATAYLKQEANRNFDLYLSTDDPRYNDATKRYDRAAVWTLVATELSFGLLAFLLLSD